MVLGGVGQGGVGSGSKERSRAKLSKAEVQWSAVSQSSERAGVERSGEECSSRVELSGLRAVCVHGERGMSRGQVKRVEQAREGGSEQAGDRERETERAERSESFPMSVLQMHGCGQHRQALECLGMSGVPAFA